MGQKGPLREHRSIAERVPANTCCGRVGWPNTATFSHDIERGSYARSLLLVVVLLLQGGSQRARGQGEHTRRRSDTTWKPPPGPGTFARDPSRRSMAFNSGLEPHTRQSSPTRKPACVTGLPSASALRTYGKHTQRPSHHDTTGDSGVLPWPLDWRAGASDSSRLAGPVSYPTPSCYDLTPRQHGSAEPRHQEVVKARPPRPPAHSSVPSVVADGASTGGATRTARTPHTSMLLLISRAPNDGDNASDTICSLEPITAVAEGPGGGGCAWSCCARGRHASTEGTDPDTRPSAHEAACLVSARPRPPFSRATMAGSQYLLLSPMDNARGEPATRGTAIGALASPRRPARRRLLIIM